MIFLIIASKLDTILVSFKLLFTLVNLTILFTCFLLLITCEVSVYFQVFFVDGLQFGFLACLDVDTIKLAPCLLMLAFAIYSTLPLLVTLNINPLHEFCSKSWKIFVLFNHVCWYYRTNPSASQGITFLKLTKEFYLEFMTETNLIMISWLVLHYWWYSFLNNLIH